MNSKTTKLFVYGTLLKGERNSRFLLKCDLLKTFSIPGKLYRTKYGYPAAVYDKNSDQRIYGELYKLPEDSKKLLNVLDELEGTGENLFKRNEITSEGEQFYLYEPSEKLLHEISDENIIRNGRWLTSGGLPCVNPGLFAKNFEFIHREYYRKKPEEISEDTVFLKGSRKILITCPHSTVHQRKGKRKIMELYTAAIGTILHSQTDCCCLYTNRIQKSDPNYYEDSEFKKTVKKVIQDQNIKFVLDIHGTGSRRKYDIYPGTGKENEFLLGNDKILEMLYSNAKLHDISVGSLDIFPAVRQMTVTKFVAREIKTPSMQLEINRRMRVPDGSGNFTRTVKLLNGFLKDI